MDYIIIVSNEAPTDCYMCIFFDDEYGICWATVDKKELRPVGFGKPIPIPNWCPLVTEEDYHNELYERLDMSLPLMPNKESESE